MRGRTAKGELADESGSWETNGWELRDEGWGLGDGGGVGEKIV